MRVNFTINTVIVTVAVVSSSSSSGVDRSTSSIPAPRQLPATFFLSLFRQQLDCEIGDGWLRRSRHVDWPPPPAAALNAHLERRGVDVGLIGGHASPTAAIGP